MPHISIQSSVAVSFRRIVGQGFGEIHVNNDLHYNGQHELEGHAGDCAIQITDLKKSAIHKTFCVIVLVCFLFLTVLTSRKYQIGYQINNMK